MNQPWAIDLESWRTRRDSAIAAILDGSSGVADASVVVGLCDALVNLGEPLKATCLLNERFPHLADPKQPVLITPEVAWMYFRARWENNSRQEAMNFSSTWVPPDDLAGHNVAARMHIWSAWGRIYEGADPSAVGEEISKFACDNRGFVDCVLLLAEYSYLKGYISFRYLGRTERALKSIDLAVALFGYCDETTQLAKALAMQSAVRKASGSLTSGLRSATESLRQAVSILNPDMFASSLTQYLICLYRLGRLYDARDASNLLLSLSREFSIPKWEFHSHLAMARVCLLSGDTREATSVLDVAELHARSSDLSGVTAALDEYRAQIAISTGDPARALELLSRAEKALIDSQANSYERAEINLRRAEAFMELGKYHDVIEECDLALERLESVGQTLERGHVLRVMALAKHSLGRPTEASELFEWAERELRRVGDIFELGKLLADKAELSRGDAEFRVADAAEAVNLLQRVGVQKELERARDVLSLTQAVLRRQNSIRVNYEDHGDQGFIAESDAMKALIADARVCGNSGVPALITGETGVGKEIFARYIHDNSSRSKKAFVAVNCAAVPESLFEREFFGHSKGAFTGADRDREGLLEAAHGGTLFLDEIGELAYSMQSKLLRVLQEGTYRRVGETRERNVDLRIISATNRRLEDRVRENSFREDLYYRLAWFEFEIPPLRSRQEDLTALARHFLAQQSRRMEMPFWIDKFAWAALRRYAWPGNIRELESAIGSGCARAGEDGCVQVEHLPKRVAKEKPLREHPDSDLNLAVALEKKERELIMEALRRTGHQRTAAAKLLGIGRNTLYDKMKRLVVDPEASRRNAANG